MTSDARMFVTGATGALGGLVIDILRETVPPGRIVAGVRDTGDARAAALRDRGIAVRAADYDDPDRLRAAFAGVDRLLLISGNAIGRRREQHRNVIDAAKASGVGFVAYTSILHADTSPLLLAEEHRDTEAALAAAGMPHALLRNGWYSEVFTWRLPAALADGVLTGAAGDGRISSAARADYARAAATVLAGGDHAGRTYELAGDAAFTLPELAETVAAVSGRAMTYRDLAPDAFEAAALAGGMPQMMARIVADTDAGIARNALFDDRGDLSRLIGRPTTPYAETIAAFVAGQAATA